MVSNDDAWCRLLPAEVGLVSRCVIAPCDEEQNVEVRHAARAAAVFLSLVCLTAGVASLQLRSWWANDTWGSEWSDVGTYFAMSVVVAGCSGLIAVLLWRWLYRARQRPRGVSASAGISGLPGPTRSERSE